MTSKTRPEFICGDALSILKDMPDESIQMSITSPPYWGLRDYDNPNQIGGETSPHDFINKIADIFDELRRVLKDDGTIWLNIGDCYQGKSETSKTGVTGSDLKRKRMREGQKSKEMEGLKRKDLVGMPWMLAFELRNRGWFLRSDIIWAKPNPIPESVIDRPTRAHESIFLFSKNQYYLYNQDSTRQDVVVKNYHLIKSNKGETMKNFDGEIITPKRKMVYAHRKGRNLSTVWWIPIERNSNPHVAVFPTTLAEMAILAGSNPGDVVIDPFVGSGTTCLVASHLGRASIGIDISEKSIKIAKERCWKDSASLEEFI